MTGLAALATVRALQRAGAATAVKQAIDGALDARAVLAVREEESVSSRAQWLRLVQAGQCDPWLLSLSAAVMIDRDAARRQANDDVTAADNKVRISEASLRLGIAHEDVANRLRRDERRTARREHDAAALAEAEDRVPKAAFP